MGRNGDAPRPGLGSGGGTGAVGVATRDDTSGDAGGGATRRSTGRRPGTGVPGCGFGFRHLHMFTSTVGFRMDDAIQTNLLLRDIYRLGRADEAVAVRWFQELLRTGYTPDIHRAVLIDIDTRGLRRSR